MKELAKYISEYERKPYKKVLDNLELEKYTHYELEVYSFEGTEYAVGTDEECDYAWEEALHQYIDDCIYPELSDFAAKYFDEDRWISDAKFDGRGHSLGVYDGNEIELENNLYAYIIN